MGEAFAESLDRKLGFKEDQKIALIGATESVLEYFQTQYPEIQFSVTLRGKFDLVIYFATRNSDLNRRILMLTRALRDKGALWVAWPKKTSGIVTDLNFDTVQDSGIAQDLVDTKICSISQIWSALRFAEKASNKSNSALLVNS